MRCTVLEAGDIWEVFHKVDLKCCTFVIIIFIDAAYENCRRTKLCHLRNLTSQPFLSRVPCLK